MPSHPRGTVLGMGGVCGGWVRRWAGVSLFALVLPLLVPSVAGSAAGSAAAVGSVRAGEVCPAVPHTSDPEPLPCVSASGRWATVHLDSGLVTGVSLWSGTNLWRPPVGHVAIDLPVGSPVGPGWWRVGGLVDGEFVSDHFERNLTAQAGLGEVHLAWSSRGLEAGAGGPTDPVVVVRIDPGDRVMPVDGREQAVTVPDLEAGVEHRFTLEATFADGRVLRSPTVSATPLADPNPGCLVADLPCLRAPTWAVVKPSTGLVVNVTVCRPQVCGADGEWAGVMPGNSLWPGYPLVMIPAGSAAGIGWSWVGGAFVPPPPVEPEPEGDGDDGVPGDDVAPGDEVEPPFEPVGPARLLDTRIGGSTIDGVMAGVGVRETGSVTRVPVVGRAGVRSGAGGGGVSAVALNVTVVGAGDAGFVTVWPCGAPRPNASNVNFARGQTIANAVVSGVGTGSGAEAGAVCVYTSAPVDLLLDVAGVFTDARAYGAMTPVRLLDTRSGGTTVDGREAGVGLREAGSVTRVPVAGRAGGGGVSGAVAGSPLSAVALTVTVVVAREAGFVTVWPCGAEMPNASNVNFASGQTIANAVVAGVGAAGEVCVYTSAATDLVIDMAGGFESGDAYRPLTPARLLDTRSGGATVDGRAVGAGVRTAGSVTQVPVSYRGGAGTADAVVLNLTVVGAREAGFVTVWPCGEAMPDASNVNFAPGQTMANALLSGIGTAGEVCVYTSAATDLLLDVGGVLGG